MGSYVPSTQAQREQMLRAVGLEMSWTCTGTCRSRCSCGSR